MDDLMQRLEQHATAYSLLGEKDLPALLREAASALRAAPEWQPIEMAPKDDTPVDLWRPVCGGERLANMRRIELSPGNVFYTAIESGYTCVRDATHWMPLPSPPLAAHLQEQGNG